MFITLVLSQCNIAFSAEGTVNITGDIHNNTCTVNTKDLNVDMGSIAAKQFYTAGVSTTPVKFSIALKDCGAAAKSVAVIFSGTAAATGSSLLALDKTTGAATGLGIAILDDKKSAIPVNSASHGYPLIAGVAAATLDFFAQYTSFNQKVTAGVASASVTFNMTYQ